MHEPRGGGDVCGTLECVRVHADGGSEDVGWILEDWI